MTVTTNDDLPAAARFLREARAIDADDILPLRADPSVAERNVSAGVAAVLVHEAHVAEHLAAVDLGELRSLPDLARCVVGAARDAGAEEGEARQLLGEAHALRRTLRAAAQALGEAGVITPRELAKLGRERGAVDVVGECSALAALFERRAADVAGKTPLGDDEVARAAEVGAALRALLKPKAAARKPGPDGLSPAEARDRLWTLLVLRHERLWAVGAYIYGHAVDDHVPPLTAPAAAHPDKRSRS